MTRDEFIKVLEEKGPSYEIEGDKIVVSYFNKDVDLDSLETLPPGVEFENRGDVYLRYIETIPPGVVFKNDGHVDLDSLEILPPGVQFENRRTVYLRSLETLPPGVEFNNGEDIYLASLRWLNRWSGNIEGIDSKRLLNLMIKQGVFI